MDNFEPVHSNPLEEWTNEFQKSDSLKESIEETNKWLEKIWENFLSDSIQNALWYNFISFDGVDQLIPSEWTNDDNWYEILWTWIVLSQDFYDHFLLSIKNAWMTKIEGLSSLLKNIWSEWATLQEKEWIDYLVQAWVTRGNLRLNVPIRKELWELWDLLWWDFKK